MQDTIRLVKDTDCWVAVYQGPHREDILSLFGTAILPTPFTRSASAERVREEIQRLNPCVFVECAARRVA